MKHLKLINGLGILQKEEWLSFRKYILMYCTKASDHYELLNYLYAIRDKFSSINEIHDIRDKLFPDMTSKSFSNLMSRIFNWLEEWLVWNDNLKDKTNHDVQLVKIYNRRGAYPLADKTYRRVEKNLLQADKLDLDTHKAWYNLYHNSYFSDNPIKYERSDEILDNLMHYFMIQCKEQALMYTTEMYNWGRLQNIDFSDQIEMLDKIAGMAFDSKEIELIHLIKKVVSALDVGSYFELRDSIYNNRIKKNSELYFLASFYMINYSMIMWNENKFEDPKVLLKAYDFGLSSGVLLNSGTITEIRFSNMVTTLGYIKTSGETYNFIDKWIHLVGGENQQAIHSLCYAQLKFIEGKYNELIPLLLGHRFDSGFGKLRASSLELIGHYYARRDDYSLIVNRVANFKRVLANYGRKRKNHTYKLYSNFVKVLDMLVKRDFIKKKINIEDYAPVIYKKWLIEEIKADQG